MCGRYVITKASSKTKNIIQKNNGVADEINYNAFPGSVLPIITKEEDQLALHKFYWGLVPRGCLWILMSWCRIVLQSITFPYNLIPRFFYQMLSFPLYLVGLPPCYLLAHGGAVK